MNGEAATPGCAPGECQWNCKDEGRPCLRRTSRYVLAGPGGAARAVGKEDWIAAERRLGLRGPAMDESPAMRDEPACRSFVVGGQRGLRE